VYDVIRKYSKASDELVNAYKNIGESASIYECMGRTGAMDSHIRPVWPGSRMCGTALTVHCRPGDNLVLHKAISIAQPGDVLVVCMDGYSEAGGMWGGLMTASAVMKGVIGLVTDAACRDTMLIKELGFPIYTRGINVKATTKALPGTINHPVIVGGVMVCPGDIIVADNDDVVVVPKSEAAAILAKTIQREEMEEAMMKKIMAGEGIVFDLNGFDKLYEKLGMTEETV
jgi:4-hydroxy-4-methyl-2-oxoglutarate aldolase